MVGFNAQFVVELSLVGGLNRLLCHGVLFRLVSIPFWP
jgi:hypothetical protein